MHRSNDKIQTAEGSLIKSLPQERFLWRCYPLLASNKLTVVQSSQRWRLCHKISLHKIKRQVQTTERQQECFPLLLASLQWRNDSSVQQQEVSVVGVHPALPYARGKGSPACPEPSGTQLGQLSSIQTAFLGCFGTHIPEEVDHRPRVCALHNSAARHNHIGTCLEDIKHPLSHTEQSHCLQLACKTLEEVVNSGLVRKQVGHTWHTSNYNPKSSSENTALPQIHNFFITLLLFTLT